MIYIPIVWIIIGIIVFWYYDHVTGLEKFCKEYFTENPTDYAEIIVPITYLVCCIFTVLIWPRFLYDVREQFDAGEEPSSDDPNQGSDR